MCVVCRHVCGHPIRVTVGFDGLLHCVLFLDGAGGGSRPIARCPGCGEWLGVKGLPGWEEVLVRHSAEVE